VLPHRPIHPKRVPRNKSSEDAVRPIRRAATPADGLGHTGRTKRSGQHDVVTFTVQLIALGGDAAGEPAWSARVFLLLDEDGIIREDYHLTAQPLVS
jgi:hypothetical protein